MKSFRRPLFRGLTVQLIAITVLPLTLLLLVITFTSVFRHQQDMRSLVAERDERAVQAAAAALDSELHHRASNIANLVAMAENQGTRSVIAATEDLASDFDGGLAYLTPDGQLLATYENPAFWESVQQDEAFMALVREAVTGTTSKPFFSSAILDPDSQRKMVVVSQHSPVLDLIVAGAFSPDRLAEQVLFTSYAADGRATMYLLDSSRHFLYASKPESADSMTSDHPGVDRALRGESGTLYVQMSDTEHVIAFSPVSSTGWALIMEEDWHSVISPSLQMTQMAPLVLVPAFILAIFALWFVARQIVQPLQRLEDKAAALAWGDFNAIEEPSGGISEIRHLQMELTEMARKVQAAQEGLHDYIGAITAAQEEERMRLARELHDETIQAVIALKQRVQLAQKSVKDQHGRHALQELESLAEQTVENLRRLVRALRPIYLEDLGLVTALEMLAREISRADGLDVDFTRSGDERRLSHEVELALYRIAQESLNNVLHHAKADRATLRITFGREVKLEIIDNGIGFSVPKSPTDFAPSGHFGLLGMRERADLIGARLEVESEPGKGTQLSIQFALSSSQQNKKKHSS